MEHEVKVRYVDGLLEKSQEWQWLIDYIEENYDLNDINNWSDFFTLNRKGRDIYSYFIKVLEVQQNDTYLEFNNNFVQELYLIAKFYIGKISREELDVKTNYSKIFQLVIWITKLENQANNTEYIMDTRLFTRRNLFELIDMSTILIYESEIKEYLRSVTLSDTQGYVQCLLDNIEGISHFAHPDLLENYRDQILSANAFDYSDISIPQNITWQEEYILNMLSIKIQDREIHPFAVFNNVSSPDISLWTEDALGNIKNYFDNSLADFIIETISYVLYKMEPSESTVLMHLRLIVKLLNDEEIIPDKLKCSSFEIIKYLKEDTLLNKYSTTSEFVTFMKEIQRISDFDILEILYETKFNLSKKQKDLIRNYYNSQYKEIDNTNFNYELIEYFQNKNTAKTLTNDYFYKVSQKFQEGVSTEDLLIIPSLFYWYMKFLIRLNNQANVDQQFLNYEIINVQALWENEFYERCVSQLTRYEKSFSLPSKDVEDYNNAALVNPFLIAQNCILANEDSMCNVMESISKNPITFMVQPVYLDVLFPEEESDSFNYERHKIDETLKFIVNKIIKERSYRFLNILDIDIYVRAIHKRYKENAKYYIGILNNQKELYEDIFSKEKSYKVLQYDEEITLGHIMQLFPILENKIRDLGKLLNIVPFKLSEKEFMNFKDPSSILREILLGVYEQLGSYENVSDLLFVYNFLYNGNSLNIRNECVHGRKYLVGLELKFAFTISLLSLSMIIKRIEIINKSIK